MVMREFGPPEVLHEAVVATPSAGPGEVVVRVAAVEVSRTRDVATRSGRHPFSRAVTLPHVLGGHCAGVVAATGADVEPGWLGRRVGVMNHRPCGACPSCRRGAPGGCPEPAMLGIHWWGSYAEYVVVPVTALHTLPDDLDLSHAAAFAATGPVALTQLRAAGAGPGTTLLVTGMTGALATVIAALGVRLGVRVVGLSRRPAAVVPGGGASAPAVTVLDSGRADLAAAILGATGGAPPDAVLDNVCAPAVFDRYWPTLANGARIVVSGAIGTPELPVLPVPARDLYARNLALIGVRSHSEAVTGEFWDLVTAGFRLPGELVHQYPLEAAPEAHTAVLEGRTTGHTVLRVTTAEPASTP